MGLTAAGPMAGHHKRQDDDAPHSFIGGQNEPQGFLWSWRRARMASTPEQALQGCVERIRLPQGASRLDFFGQYPLFVDLVADGVDVLPVEIGRAKEHVQHALQT